MKNIRADILWRVFLVYVMMLLFGIAMVMVMIWKPRGFVGNRTPTAFLFQRKQVSGSFTTEGHG